MIRWSQRIQEALPDKKDELYQKALAGSGWFVPENIDQAFEGIYNYLDEKKMNSWLKSYDLPSRNGKPKNVGIVMAGNIPLVGFHDLLSVLCSGHNCLIKTSSQDHVLIPFLLNLLLELEPKMVDRVKLVDNLKKQDAVIATGSDNTSRYFQYYFRDIPNIIRKNRTSIGVIEGNESNEDLLKLGNDILQYFGLGCRNISKIFIPEGYQLAKLFEAIQPLEEVTQYHKYLNNYDYNKSIYLVNREPFLETGFLLFKQSDQLVSPVSVVYYDYYKDQEDIEKEIASVKDKIQCVASKNSWIKNSLEFGTLQTPDPWDYADNVDTMKFLLSI